MDLTKLLNTPQRKDKSERINTPLLSTQELADKFDVSISAVSIAMRQRGIEAVTIKVKHQPRRMYPKTPAILAMRAAGFKG